MSIFSGVVSAKLYHQDKSQPVAPWIRRIISFISLRSVLIKSSTNQKDVRRSEKVAEKQCGELRTVDISIYPESSFDDENAGNDKNSNEDKPEDFDYHDY